MTTHKNLYRHFKIKPPKGWRHLFWWRTPKFEETLRKVREVEEEVHPHPLLVFRALKLLKPEDVKVVILGLDPYHTPGMADGLAFSVQPGKRVPPSLHNIFKELNSDLGIKPITNNGSLQQWAKNGVLLLNTCLTVTTRKPGSHLDYGWDGLVYEIIMYLANNHPNVTYILWGTRAGAFEPAIRSRDRTSIICTKHPSPLANPRRPSKNLPPFFGSKCFSEACRMANISYTIWERKA